VIHVWDASDSMPVRQEAAPGDDGGRGLMIIEALSADWGAYRKAEGGKVRKHCEAKKFPRASSQT
jgi:hypothetical protein